MQIGQINLIITRYKPFARKRAFFSISSSTKVVFTTNPTNTQKANISTKNTSYFEHGTEWNAEKAEKTPIFAKKSAHNEQL